MRWTHQIVASYDPETVVPVSEVKDDLDVDFADDDALIASHRNAAVRWVENHTNRFLGTTVVRFLSDRLPDLLHLPFAPVQSVTTMTVAGSVVAEPTSIPGEPWGLTAPSGQRWPFFMAQPGAVQVEYVVGYPDAQSVPDEAKQAVKMICGIFYDKPEKPDNDWRSVEALLNGLRIRNIG